MKELARLMKITSMLAFLWMQMFTPVYAQGDNSVVKMITTGTLGREQITYPLSEIDSITIGRETMAVPSLEEVTLEKLDLLIPSIYPIESPAMICELGSDNFIDNNVYLPYVNFNYTGLYPKFFTWSDVSDDASYVTAYDSPLAVWQSYLQSIAVCDYILKATDALETAQPALSTSLKSYRAEAYIVRSYLRSVLAGVFDVDFASLIDADLQAGLSLIDYLQDTDASRMTRRAANAYAARHYLLKHDWSKVEQYATAALGSNPAANLRNWSTLDQSSMDTRMQAYYSTTESANYYIQRTYSLRTRLLSSCRFRTPDKLFNGGGPAWSGYLPAFDGNLFVFMSQEYGIWFFRAYEFFEYTDEEASLGHVIGMYTPFTAEETLLMRAEARYYQRNMDGCLADLSTWMQSKMVVNPLTMEGIESKYQDLPSNEFVNNVNMAATGWSEADMQVVAQNKPLLDCLLHFRRIETLYDGLRWMDLKRYGINIQHVSREPFSEELTFQSNYTRPQPSDMEAIGANQVVLHKNGESIAIQSVKEILFGGDEESDEAARQSFVPSANGWVLQSFDLPGEGSITYFSNEDCQIVSEGFMTLMDADLNYPYLYRILDMTPGEEILLQDVSEDSDYPKTLRLVACPMPWDEYQEACEQMSREIWVAKVWNNGSVFLSPQNACVIISHDAGFANDKSYQPFVYTPTGIRFADEQVFSCDPEFIFDKNTNTFTSKDGLVTFETYVDIDALLQELLTKSTQREIMVDDANEELKNAIEAIDAGIALFSANYSFASLFFGKSSGYNSQQGIGFSFYANAAKTRTNNCGVSSTLICKDGHLSISTPGLADDMVVMDQNMQTLIDKAEELKPAILNMLNLMEGEYVYSVESAQSGTIEKAHFTKVGNDTFKFSVQF